MFCTSCGTKNADAAKFCTNCGNSLKPAEKAESTRERVGGGTRSTSPNPRRQAANPRRQNPQSGNPRNPQRRPHGAVSQQSETSPILAAVLSFFIPGLGQFINSDVKKGAIMLGGTVITFGVLWLPFAIWSVIDAYQVASGDKQPWK